MSELITVTESAATKALQLLAAAQKNHPEDGVEGLRVAIIGGGCAGLQQILKFDSFDDDKDLLVESHGLKVIVDMKSATLLTGATIDYTDDLMDPGFKIKNPQQKNGCGCGRSFSA